MEFSHFSVMLDECIDGLNIKPEGIYVDGTAGGAGHSSHIAKKLTTGRLIAIDKDPDAIKIASERLSEYECVQVVEGDFSQIPLILDRLGIKKVDGILLDIGVSSHQLDTAERGFSFHQDAPLDMRMSQSGLSAYDVVNVYSKQDLTRIIRSYGEEKYAQSIASNIEKYRKTKPIETTFELVDIIRNSMPFSARRDGHPGKKTFQAIRIEVNKELDRLTNCINESFEYLNPEGRFCIITFHSLEDRIVKQEFVSYTKGCTCPSSFPVCICNNRPKAKLVCRKPIEASKEELETNSRSRSAKLRILEKI